MVTCLDLVQRCTHEDPNERPNIWDIISDLDKTDNTEVDIRDASKYQELEDMLGIEPLEICLPLELNTQASCSIELSNDTDNYFAFKISTTSVRQYCIEESKGTVPPRSKCSVAITLQVLEEALPDNRSSDEFFVKSTRIDENLTALDIGGGNFSEKLGKVVDTVRFTVILSELESSPSGDER